MLKIRKELENMTNIYYSGNNRLKTLNLSYNTGLNSLEAYQVTIIIIITTRPWPAFGRLGLGGLSGGYSSHE